MSRFSELVSGVPAAVKAGSPASPLTSGLLLKFRETAPSKVDFLQKSFGGHAVTNSEDLARIVNLPRRDPPLREELERLVEKWTTALQTQNSTCVCGTKHITRLFPVQAWYLEEASTNGVLGHIVIGGGKTGIDILLSMCVPNVRTAVVLIPASLKTQFLADYKAWSQHFKVPNLAGSFGPFYSDRPVLHVLTYSQLSTARFATILKAKNPDMVILDEAQNLKDFKAVRTSRFIRHMAENLRIKLFAHSGSLTTRSLRDYGHLSALALREGSPLPIEPGTLQEWCSALDPGSFAPVGALKRLCEVGETGRAGFRRRLVQTPGVIVTEDAKLSTRLVLKDRPLEVPEEVKKHLTKIRNSATRPDGEELVEAIEVAACLRQMAAGLYLRWKFPRGEPVPAIDTWFNKRSAWHRALRERLKTPIDHADSPLLLSMAAERALGGEKSKSDAPVWKEGADAWSAWKDVRDTVHPETDVVWVSDFMVKDAVVFGKESPSIIWVEHVALGHAIAKLGSFPYYGGGALASAEVLKEDGKRTIVASISAHSQGKNLQMFNRNLVTTWPASDGVCEQLIGRTHRTGQTAEIVTVAKYTHTLEEREAFKNAVGQAEYVQQTTGATHRLLFAEKEKT